MPEHNDPQMQYDPRTPLGIQAASLSAVAGQAITEQLIKGQKKGYDGWQNANTFTLAMKAVAAAAKGNWPSVIAYGAMLYWQWKHNQQEQEVSK